MDYYVKRGHNRQILASAYRADQRSQRIAWANLYYPETPNPYLTFKGCWYRSIDADADADADEQKQYPSEYALSQGLCIPASAVFRAQRDWYLSDSIITAFNDIEDAVLSGVLIPTPTPTPTPTPLSEVGNNSTIAANQLLTMISFIKKGGPKGYGYGLKLSS